MACWQLETTTWWGSVACSSCNGPSPPFSSDGHCNDGGCCMLFRKFGVVIAPSLSPAIRWSVIIVCLVCRGKQHVVVRISPLWPCLFWGNYKKMPSSPCFCKLKRPHISMTNPAYFHPRNWGMHWTFRTVLHVPSQLGGCTTGDQLSAELKGHQEIPSWWSKQEGRKGTQSALWS